jgi:hypothetical protein
MTVSEHGNVPKYTQSFEGLGAGIVSQGDDAHFACALSEKWLFGLIQSGAAELEVSCHLPYQSVSTSKEYEFTSVHRYSVLKNWFEHVSSSMT